MHQAVVSSDAYQGLCFKRRLALMIAISIWDRQFEPPERPWRDRALAPQTIEDHH
jgi:hypothetical protein